MSLKRGYLVEVTWLDAAFCVDLSDFSEKDLRQGGCPIISTGYIAGMNNKAFVLVAELDEDRTPSRDFNLIPKCLVQKVRILKRGSFGKAK